MMQMPSQLEKHRGICRRACMRGRPGRVSYLAALISVAFWLLASEPAFSQTRDPLTSADTGQADSAPPLEKIRQWVADLADPDFSTRETAQRRLLKLGRLALDPLRAVQDSSDIEQRLRARDILRELDRQSLWEPTRVSRQEKDVLAVDVFRHLADETGNPIHWARSPKSFSQKVDVNWTSVPYWQAIDDLSRLSQIVPRVYDDPSRSGLVLTHGDPGDYPAAYVGPLRLHLLGLRRSTTLGLNLGDRVTDEQDSLELTSMLTWEQRFDLCRYTGRPRIVRALTDADEDLGIERPAAVAMMHLARRQRQLVFSSRIRPPSKPATRFTQLDLEFDFVAAGDFQKLEVKFDATSATTENNGYELELMETKKLTDRIEIVLNWSRPVPYDKMNLTDMADEYLEVLDESEQVLPHSLHQVVGGRESVRYTVHVLEKQGKPTAIRYNVAMLKSERTIRFRFRDVPLPVASRGQ